MAKEPMFKLQTLFEKRAKTKAKSDAKLMEDLLQDFGDHVRMNPKTGVDELLDHWLDNIYKPGSVLHPFSEKEYEKLRKESKIEPDRKKLIAIRG